MTSLRLVLGFGPANAPDLQYQSTTDCRTFWPQRPLSVLYAANEFVAEMSCNQLLIDIAMQLLTMNLSTLTSIAMSL